MTDKTYSVELTTNPDQPELIYWSFDSLDKAQQFFVLLKEGKASKPVTLHLADVDGHCAIESFTMSDDGRGQSQQRRVNYQELLQQLKQDPITTGTRGEKHLIID